MGSCCTLGEPKPLGAAWRRLDLSFLLLASLGASSPPPSSRAVAGARACFLALRRSWIDTGGGGIDKGGGIDGVGGGGGIDGVGGGGPAHRRQWLGTLTLAQLTGLSLGADTAQSRRVRPEEAQEPSLGAWAAPRLHVDHAAAPPCSQTP